MSVSVFLIAGCGDHLLSTSPPRVDNQAIVDKTVKTETPLTTVNQNVIFAETLMEMYDARAVDLRDAGYWSTIPFYAAAVATGVVLLHGANTNVVADIGLGVGGYYALTQSLDFSGRAEVLANSVSNWQCFSDAAGRVAFVDPDPGQAASVTGRRIVARRDRLVRNLDKARAYLYNGARADDATFAALRAAIAVGEKALPMADGNVQAASDVNRNLNKYRRMILRSVASSYVGKMKPFSYKGTIDGINDNMDSLVQYKAKAQNIRDSLAANSNPGVDATGQGVLNSTPPVPAPAPAVAAPADSKEVVEADQQARVDGLPPLAKGVDGTRQMRAMIYVLTETARQVADDPDAAALAALPVELAKCVP